MSEAPDEPFQFEPEQHIFTPLSHLHFHGCDQFQQRDSIAAGVGQHGIEQAQEHKLESLLNCSLDD
jgi:hypothetical protein